MSKSSTLVIMAAGAARRYGGLKQLAPVGPSGEAIMEYSIHDAIRAGFKKVVLVVREEFEATFREKFADRAANHVDISFAFQEPSAFVTPAYAASQRSKPWGTAHAVLCAKGQVDGCCAVINADDFYGQQAFSTLGQHLVNQTSHDSTAAAMVGYTLANTLSDHGSVNRGVCRADSNGYLVDVIERFNIARAAGGAAYDLPTGERAPLSTDSIVSMNLWGYPPAMFDHLESRFANFLASRPDSSMEFELPTVTKQLMSDGLLKVKVLPTTEVWCGMTYQEDLPIAQQRLASLVDSGVYPEQLW